MSLVQSTGRIRGKPFKTSRVKVLVKENDKYVTKRQVKKIINRRIQKKIILASSTNVYGSTATVAAFTMPTQGDAINSREGDTFKFINIHGRFESIYADTTNITRLIFFQWHPDNAVDTPAANDILATTTYPWMSPYNIYPGDKAKYTILYDKRHVMSANGTGCVLSHINVPASKFRKTKMNTGAANGVGTLYYLLVSDSSAATHPSLTFVVNMVFVDI